MIRREVSVPDAASDASSSIDLTAMVAGDVRRYQYWYRDSVTSVCGSNLNLSPCGVTFHLSHGLEIVWTL